MTIIDEILDFMSSYQIYSYDDLFYTLLKIKNKSKSLKRYLNGCYGSVLINENPKQDLYLEASKLQGNYPHNIKINNNKLKITILYKTYIIDIGYIFVRDQITLSQYPELLTCFMLVPKSICEKIEEPVLQIKDTSFLAETEINDLYTGKLKQNNPFDKLFSLDTNPCIEIKQNLVNNYAKDKMEMIVDYIKGKYNAKVILLCATPMSSNCDELKYLLELLQADKNLNINNKDPSVITITSPTYQLKETIISPTYKDQDCVSNRIAQSKLSPSYQENSLLTPIFNPDCRSKLEYYEYPVDYHPLNFKHKTSESYQRHVRKFNLNQKIDKLLEERAKIRELKRVINTKDQEFSTINSTPKSHRFHSETSEKDILLIINQTGCTKELAEKVYLENDCDIVNTIVSLTM